ncbi:MAG: SEC-C domain-containing protein [Proteobacteria bacterium]|nr:SEC-C domain-containing protein [Pseudomonadota bacterium]
MAKINRNDPCPCGSGKKFKKCCLGKELESQRKPITYHEHCIEVVTSLRPRILQFMKKAGHDKFIEKAFREYWRTLEPGLDPPELGKVTYLEFLEWFIHDYPIVGHGKPVIRLFLESNPELPPEELQILLDWQDANISVFQVKEVEIGKGVLAEDIFSSEDFFLSDVSLSKQVKKWELITFRKIKVLGEWQLSAAGGKEHPKYKEDIRRFVMDHFKHYKKHNRTADLPVFLREKGYLLAQRFLTLKAKPPEMPKLFTSSGEKLEFWEARYDLTDFHKALDLLDQEEDFQQTDLDEDDQRKPLKVFYDWLERGKSAGQIKQIQPPGGVQLRSFYTSGPGMESYRILGSVTLEPGRLVLTSQGKERLAIGKRLLENTLQNLIKHRMDAVQSLESMMEEQAKGTPKKLDNEIPLETKQVLLNDMYDKHYREWLDCPLQALGGKSPRKAIKFNEGRRRIEDLLREMEYLHNESDDKYDISWVRKELKL